ncbi:MAG: LytTR family transcriptional regulator [Clostridiales bacterium]|nr:LytTR family transcriptional regulator [Clostridiales bacterium]
MEVNIKKIDTKESEYVEIGCWRVTERIDNIVRYIKLNDGSVEASKDEKKYQIAIADILYIESVDEKSFIYLKDDCYESRRRLYDLEEMLKPNGFMRISKSVLVNLMRIESIKPALNGRFLCRLSNNEEVIISRKYVPAIKKKLRGE